MVANAMTPPTSTRVNNFVKDTTYIDPISKFFIVSEAAFGFFRLSLRNKHKHFFYFLAVFYCLFLNVFFLYITFVYRFNSADAFVVAQTIQYIFCSIFGFICYSRLQMYYTTLNRFDLEVGCRPRLSRNTLQNLVQAIITVISFAAISFVPRLFGVVKDGPYQFLIMHISYTLEVNYYGHLLNLITPRLKLINYLIESSLSNGKAESRCILKDFESRSLGVVPPGGHCHMMKLMDLYLIMVEAYDFLIEAIKWQFLVIIITAFLSILGFTYLFSSSVINGKWGIENVLYQMVLSGLVMIPLFSPCTAGDKVYRQVRRLRELLASRLYENKLDKSSRGIARALLAFTDTRDLSFRLLRMLNIDISLPFKFAGLLVTYLIILLQFEKVINP